MAHPAEAELLAPLAVDEILLRLLLSPIGPRVAQIGQQESSVQRVAKAVSWVREHFAEPMTLEALADLVHMSVSSFHQHFKAVTAMTPLQYQKVLRLQEARRLMLSRMLDAGSAARQVGYLSASQFSREYTRLFGNAPTRDVATLRQEGARGTRTPANEGKQDHAETRTRQPGSRSFGHRLRLHGARERLRAGDRSARGGPDHPCCVRARCDPLRHCRGVRPVHQRGSRGRGARAIARPGVDRHEVRLGHR